MDGMPSPPTSVHSAPIYKPEVHSFESASAPHPKSQKSLSAYTMKQHGLDDAFKAKGQSETVSTTCTHPRCRAGERVIKTEERTTLSTRALEQNGHRFLETAAEQPIDPAEVKKIVRKFDLYIMPCLVRLNWRRSHISTSAKGSIAGCADVYVSRELYERLPMSSHSRRCDALSTL